MSAPHTLNRALLSTVAVAFVAAGGAGLAAALGVFGSAVEHGTLYDNPPGRYVGQHGTWIWPVAAAVSVLLALLALRWLLAQVDVQRTGSLTIDAPSKLGTTTLRAGALTDAVAEQISGYRGVQSAQARMLGDPGAERLALAVTVADRVPFGVLRERIETEAVAAARAALEAPSFPVVLVLDTTTKAPR